LKRCLQLPENKKKLLAKLLEGKTEKKLDRITKVIIMSGRLI
jgi:hypothetical protein